MRIEISDEQRLLKETFERLFRTESSPARVRAAEPAGFDRELWQQLSDMGALTMRAPEVVGGGGFTLLDALLVMEEAGKQLVSAPLTEAIRSEALRVGKEFVSTFRCRWSPVH